MTLVKRFEQAIEDDRLPVVVIVAEEEDTTAIEMSYAASYTVAQWSVLRQHPSARSRMTTLIGVMRATKEDAGKKLG